ncbi:hypothetical protein [Ideonella sp. YS5]|uniref:hypothetical protein n=1 Tax=Ideonella sp. YS5 TaxID=3453714 RepID=UPI003EE9A3C8
MTRPLTPSAPPHAAHRPSPSGDTHRPATPQPGGSNPPPSTFQELPPRGLQALESTTLSRRAPLPVESRLTTRGQAATIPLRQPDRIAAQEIPLAAYVAARALDGRKVEPEDLDRLRRSDESLREARALLPYGRGNVREDHRQGFGQATTRVEAARTLEFATLTASTAARALWAGAGNCGEHAVVTTFAHAGRLSAGSGETVVMLGNVVADHGWAESVMAGARKLSSLWKPDEKTIVLDAWKDGPAVFAPDSTRVQWKWLSAFTFIKVDGPRPELLGQAKSDARHIALEHDPRNLPSQNSTWGLLRAQPGVSEAFVQRALSKPVSAQEALAVALKGRPVTGGEATSAAVLPAEVRQEILVAGVAREFLEAPQPLETTAPGRGRVRSAADQAPEVMAAIGRLAQVQVRQHFPGFLPSFGPPFTLGLPVQPRLVTRPVRSPQGPEPA